jgi:hypothetical protein
MSLSSWIRDYVFVPLATLRREPWWRYLALLLSMVLFGLWHGATLTFVVWGAYQGVLLVIHRIGQQLPRKPWLNAAGAFGNTLSWLVTFTTVSLGWILFRANDLGQAMAMFKAVISLRTYQNVILPPNYYGLVLGLAAIYLAYTGIVISGYVNNNGWLRRALEHVRNTDVAGPILQYLWDKRWWWLTPSIVTVGVLALLVLSLQSSDVSPFIYAVF